MNVAVSYGWLPITWGLKAKRLSSQDMFTCFVKHKTPQLMIYICRMIVIAIEIVDQAQVRFFG